MNEYTVGATSVVEEVFIQDSASTTGAGKTGLVFNTSGLTCYYKRSNGTASVSVTLVTITTLGTFVSGGFKAIDGTNMPGLYEFHPPDAAFASGAKSVTFYFVGASGMVARPMKFRITTVNPDSANAFMTGVNSLSPPTNWNLMSIDSNGRLDVIKLAGTPQTARDVGASVNVGNINTVSTASVTTIGANQGTTQPINFTGTGASALVKGDTIDWNSVAVTGMPMPTYTQPTGFLAATFPTTVASTTNITAGTITTVTTLTNLPTAPTDWITSAAVSAAAVTKIQSGLATPTNITAGTITTVTNLTNLPAAPTDWITAISFSAAAVTKVQNGIATTTNLNAVASDISSIITILGTPVDESISNDIANSESAILTEGGPGPWTGGGGGGGSLTTTQNALLQSGTEK